MLVDPSSRVPIASHGETPEHYLSMTSTKKMTMSKLQPLTVAYTQSTAGKCFYAGMRRRVCQSWGCVAVSEGRWLGTEEHSQDSGIFVFVF